MELLRLPLLLGLLVQGALAFQLRNLKVEVANEESAGMNGPSLFTGGGAVRLRICANGKVRYTLAVS